MFARIRNHLWIAALCAVLFTVPSLPASAGTTGAINGTVTDSASHPIAAVQVTASSPSGSERTTTGGNGFYALNGLPLDTYLLTFSKPGFQTSTVPGVTVAQDQSRRIDVTLQTGPRTLGTVTVRSAQSLVQPSTTASSYVVNSRTLEDINGTPQDLNGFQAFNSLPGVTTDYAGYPVIRAGAENDVGYQFDGIDNTDPVTGQFLNAVTLNGARSVQLATGGYDVATGNTNSGVINEVIKRGVYPGGGQATFRIGFPAYDHEISIDYGSSTPDNRISYYFSFGGQRNDLIYGDNATLLPLTLGFQNDGTLNDFVGNLFYRWGNENRNEIQFLTNISGSTLGFETLVNAAQAPYATINGNVQAGTNLLNFPCDPSPCLPLSSYITLFPGQVAVDQNIGSTDTQTFNSTIDKLNYKRQFSPSSFADLTLFRTSENLISSYPYNFGSFTDTYQDLNTVGLGVQADYDNQLSNHHEIGLGGTATYYFNQFRAAFPSLEPFAEPLEAIGCPQLLSAAPPFYNAANPNPATGVGGCYIGPLNAQLNAQFGPFGMPLLPTGGPNAPLNTFADSTSYSNSPVHRYDIYAKDRWQPDDKLTVTFGLRWDMETIGLPADAAAQNVSYFTDDAGNIVTIPGQPLGSDVTRPSQISPRIAVAYQLTPHDVVRASFGKNIEFVPLSAVENSYQIDPALQNCSIASGCFQPLPGYSPTCVNGVDPANANANCNGFSNLYQQILADLNTNNFLSYTPVVPQKATNYDFSYEHDFGHGLDVKITPYYRHGTDYVVTNSNFLFNLPSGTPVFGPARSVNAGVNYNTGVEFEIQKQATFGFSGFFDATYDNTLANYDSDFFPSVNNAAIAAGHLYHVTYVSPLTANLVLAYDSRQGFHASVDLPYTIGYPYGVGTKTFVFVQCGQVPTCSGDPNSTIPYQVLNTDLAASTASQAYYFTDPSNPGTILNPNIVASRGTPEGSDPGTLRSPAILIVNATVSQTIGHGPNNMQVGMRVQNLFGNYTSPPTLGSGLSSAGSNPYYVPNGFGGVGPDSGFNTNQCPKGVVNAFACEPFQNNYSPYPYESEAMGQPRLYTFFVSFKY
ncbi:MAG: TonB-dependent receptor [Candidatus Eremiobacteraeota bacterium]|nr:TonB-dependent receptor [Candidatus Eremiobacteraeota bacterium]MBV8366821.1 TonB-dependent receptor [Candidatus Eremiobacteraeota bacterium]